MGDRAGNKAARHVLRALIQGMDPATGKTLEPGSVVQRLDVMKALTVALEALTERPVSAGRQEPEAAWTGRKKPDRAGQGWDRAEDDALRRMFGQRRRVSDIAAEMGRTSGAVTSRLVGLGLVKARSSPG